MEMWVVALIIAFIFLSYYMKQPLLSFVSIILLISQIFVVQNTFVMLALIFATLYLFFNAITTKY